MISIRTPGWSLKTDHMVLFPSVMMADVMSPMMMIRTSDIRQGGELRPGAEKVKAVSFPDTASISVPGRFIIYTWGGNVSLCLEIQDKRAGVQTNEIWICYDWIKDRMLGMKTIVTTRISGFGQVVIGNLQHQFSKCSDISNSNCNVSWRWCLLSFRNVGSVLWLCYNCLASWRQIQLTRARQSPSARISPRVGQREAGPGSGEKIL